MNYIYNAPVNFNIPQISFRNNPTIYIPQTMPSKDGFATNPLYDNFGTKSQIEAEAKNNIRIQEIMNKYDLPIKANMEELERLKRGHLRDTRIVAAQIYSSLPQEMKNQINLSDLQEAAMFHDYGKVLIPEMILNKNGELTPKEREIMEQHSEIGYELLKNKGLNQNTLEMIKYHHQTPDGGGYPIASSDYEYGLDVQILNAADKYSALREERSYKDAMDKKEALNIIKEDVNLGKISPEIYYALEKSV